MLFPYNPFTFTVRFRYTINIPCSILKKRGLQHCDAQVEAAAGRLPVQGGPVAQTDATSLCSKPPQSRFLLSCPRKEASVCALSSFLNSRRVALKKDNRVVRGAEAFAAGSWTRVSCLAVSGFLSLCTTTCFFADDTQVVL